MKHHLDLAVINYRESWLPICNFNYKTWFWQHVKTLEFYRALLTYHAETTSVSCTELIPKEALVSHGLLGAEPQAKTRPRDVENHELESLTSNSLLFWLPTLELHLSKCCQLGSSFRILLESASPEITIAFLFYKPRLFIIYFLQHSDLEECMNLTALFIAEHFFVIWE